MKYTYIIEDLDCAHCAAKMEKEISKISGVENVQINFLAQKLVIDADETQISDIMKKAVSVCKKIEPDCTIILE